MTSAISGRSPTPSRSCKRLHRRRNYVPVSETLHELLGATRAHVGFALRTGGEQALANAFHVAELARQFEAGGGISFRGFVEELRVAAEHAVAAEAPILEEDSDGVRMMTVHKAKGLEFPIVILADLTCKLARAEAGRWIDPEQNICALKLGGWAPIDLLLHDAEESARDRAEGERLAYVAATRARDVLVVPAVGDEIYEGGWLDPLMPAIYPPLGARRDPDPGAGLSRVPVEGHRADAGGRRSRQAHDRRAWHVRVHALPAASFQLQLPASRVPGSRIPDPGSRHVSRRVVGPARARPRRRRTPAACGATTSSRRTAIRPASTSAWASIARGRPTGPPRSHAPARRAIVSHTATDLARDRHAAVARPTRCRSR